VRTVLPYSSGSVNRRHPVRRYEPEPLRRALIVPRSFSLAGETGCATLGHCDLYESVAGVPSASGVAAIGSRGSPPTCRRSHRCLCVRTDWPWTRATSPSRPQSQCDKAGPDGGEEAILYPSVREYFMSEKIIQTCPGCKKLLEFDASCSGQPGRCLVCNTQLTILEALPQGTLRCPKCGGVSTKDSTELGLASRDKPSAAMAAVNIQRGGHPLLVAASLAWMAAKSLMSTPYTCSKCHHQWRDWI